MAKHDKDKHDKEQKKKAARPDAASGGHHVAGAHGHAATVDASLPGTRDELMARHAEARKRRNSAPLDSEAFRAAVDELGRIEVRVAAVERDMVPPKG
jgi:hypothetical protein